MRPYIKIRQLNISRKSSGGNDRISADGLEAEFNRGEVIGITGLTASGKSTLASYLAGLSRPEKLGMIQIDGLDPFSQLDEEKIHRMASLAFQNAREGIFFEEISADLQFGLENLGLPRGKIRHRLSFYLKKFGIHLKKHQHYQDLTEQEIQRLQLVKVLASKPDLLILDEALSLQKDAASILDFLIRSSRNQKRTIIFFSRNRELLEKSDRVLVLDKGRLTEITEENPAGMQGRLDQILGDPQETEWVNDRDPRLVSRVETGKRILQLPENPDLSLLDDNVLSDVMQGAMAEGIRKSEARSRAEAVLRTIGMDESVWNRSPFTLSEGEKKILQISEAITVNPDILILHSPYTSLDRENRERINLFLLGLKQQGMEILITDSPFRPVTDRHPVSGLQNLHPGLKTWALVITWLLLLISFQPLTLGVSILTAAVFTFLSQVNIRKFLKSMSGALVASAVLSLICVFTASPAYAGKLFVKMALYIWMTDLFFQTTRDRKLLDGLISAFHLRANLAADIFLMVDYLPVFGVMGQYMSGARRIRGIPSEEMTWQTKFFSFLYQTASRFNLACSVTRRRKQELKAAHFTSVSRRRAAVPLKWHRQDSFLVAGMVVYIAAIIFVKVIA